jgi:hypothetical protein
MAEHAILILNAMIVALLTQFREQQWCQVRKPMNMDEQILQTWESRYNNMLARSTAFFISPPKITLSSGICLYVSGGHKVQS